MRVLTVSLASVSLVRVAVLARVAGALQQDPLCRVKRLALIDLGVVRCSRVQCHETGLVFVRHIGRAARTGMRAREVASVLAQ